MFSGKTIVVTGASSGLGQALALRFAREHANLALFARNAARLEDTADQCRKIGATALIVAGDVTRPEDCANLIDSTVREFGSLDYLVANAGVSMWARFDQIKDVAVFRKLMETNYLGVVHATYYALKHLKQSGGMIVAISSIQGKIGVPYHTGYAASKHALHGFFASLQSELEGSGVDILLVLPHWMKGTDLRMNAFGADGQVLGDAKLAHTSEAVSLDDCSQAIVVAMRKRKRELVYPAKLRILPWLNLINPRIVAALVKRKGVRHNDR